MKKTALLPAILLIFACYSNSLFGKEAKVLLCEKVFSDLVPSENSETIVLADESMDAAFLSNLSADGVLTLTVINRQPDRARSSEQFNAKLAVKNVFRHWGSKIRVAQANWENTPGIDDNFKAFKLARKRGMNIPAAIFETWTGKQFKEAGFAKVKSIDFFNDVGQKVNEANCTRITINFTR